MKLYGFELGRQKELSLAELYTVFGKESFVEKSADIAIFKLEEVDIPQKLQDRLGGTIRIIEIFKQTNKESVKSEIQSHLEEDFSDSSGKIPFSISLFAPKKYKDINIKDLLNFSKKILKSLGLNSRFVNKDLDRPKSSTIYKAKVVEKGVDICLIQIDEMLFIGKTAAIQNIDAYSKRDYDKPGRDPKVGMLPPKLAQIMINIAGESSVIYDPFCGTGTVLTEGLLMDKEVIGSDMDERMVKYSNKNCEWLQKEFYKKGKFEVFEKDARFLTKSDIKTPIDAIVTEGYLGPPLIAHPSEEETETIFRELANLHLNWLTAISELIKKGTIIVMCLAAHKAAKGVRELTRFKEIAEMAGFQINKSYRYQRSDQIVLRDIKILEKI